jgi:hypothetical protein
MKKKMMNRILSNRTSTILITMVVLNFICDILLFYNFSGSNVDFSIENLNETPIAFIKYGSLIGVFALSTLIAPIFGWIKNKVLSYWIIIPYLLFVLGCVLFHGLFYFLGKSIHNNEDIQFANLKSFVEILGLFIFLLGIILTAGLIINRHKKKIYYPCGTILLFPLVTMIFFGVILNKVIYLPEPIGGYYSILSGTIPIFLLMLSLRKIKTLENEH